MSTVIDLIRHGEPAGGRRYRGHNVDDPLTAKGWCQMWDAVGDDAPWQQIITSPLQRCQDFAHALGERHNIPVTIEDHFKEVGFGAWEGFTHEQLKSWRSEEYENFYRDPLHFRPEGAEPLEGFIERATTAYLDVIKQFEQQHCLIVSHAGVIRAIIAHTVHAPPLGLYRIKISNAGISRIRYGKNGGVLESLNQINSKN